MTLNNIFSTRRIVASGNHSLKMRTSFTVTYIVLFNIQMGILALTLSTLFVFTAATRSLRGSYDFVDTFSKFYEMVDKIVNKNSAMIEMTPDIFTRSILNMGDIQMLSTFMDKISSGKCTKVLTIGGSICAGVETNHLQNSAL